MAKYLLLKHYRGAPAAVNDVPMDQWTPEEISAHMQFMDDFAKRPEGTGEFVDGQELAPEGTWVRYDGEGRPPVTDGPVAETKDLIAGWMVIDVDSFVGEVHGYQKQGASYGYTRKRGYHPLLATLGRDSRELELALAAAEMAIGFLPAPSHPRRRSSCASSSTSPPRSRSGGSSRTATRSG